MVKNGCDQFGLLTLKLAVSPEWTDGINWFFACWHKFTQTKRWLKNSGLSMVKNGCGQFGDRTLKLTVSEEWTDGINWVLACWHKFRRPKCWFSDFWVGMVKNGHGLLVDETQFCCILRMNLWIELIFWMVIVMHHCWLDGHPTFWFLNAGDPLQLYFLFFPLWQYFISTNTS